MIDGAPRNGSGATVPVAIVCKSLKASAGDRYCRNRAKPSVENATVLIPTQWRGFVEHLRCDTCLITQLVRDCTATAQSGAPRSNYGKTPELPGQTPGGPGA